NRAFFYAGFEQDFLHTSYWTLFQEQPPGTTIPPSLLSQQQRIVERNNPTALFGRSDIVVNPANTLNFEVNYNRLRATNVGIGSARVDFTNDNAATLEGNSFWGRSNLATSFGSRVVNQASVQWSRDRRNFSPNSGSPELFINGFGVLGGNSLYPHRYISSQLQVADDVAVSRGSTLLHVGAQFAYDPAKESQEFGL